MTETALLGTRSVSRETMARLQIYEALLRKWNPAINLVARSTLDDVWGRHFVDSAQIYNLAGKGWSSWADLGSGGGFPGLVIANIAAESQLEAKVILVESDQRKATFLRTVARETGVKLEVIADRAESLAPLAVDILSARALAPLDRLMSFAKRHLSPTGVALFPKGVNHGAELRQALETWRFSYDAAVSETDPAAVIYAIKGISRV